jgi:hypothetical protein
MKVCGIPPRELTAIKQGGLVDVKEQSNEATRTYDVGNGTAHGPIFSRLSPAIAYRGPSR